MFDGNSVYRIILSLTRTTLQLLAFLAHRESSLPPPARSEAYEAAQRRRLS